MIDYIPGVIYSCDCGYKTISSHQACQHSKTKKCNGKTLSKRNVEFVLKEDHLAALGQTSPATNVIGNNANTHNGDNITNNITNVTLVLPERTTKEDFEHYAQSLDRLGYKSSSEILSLPGQMLMFTRDAKKLPGALVERNNKIVEKMPDGSERVMAKKKAIQTYTHEAVDALWRKAPVNSVSKFLDTERGVNKKQTTLQEAAKLRVTNPPAYHNKTPDDVKFCQGKMENHTEQAIDKITTDNKLNGFL